VRPRETKRDQERPSETKGEQVRASSSKGEQERVMFYSGMIFGVGSLRIILQADNYSFFDIFLLRYFYFCLEALKTSNLHLRISRLVSVESKFIAQTHNVQQLIAKLLGSTFSRISVLRGTQSLYATLASEHQIKKNKVTFFSLTFKVGEMKSL
jgi:hypothetical protein